MPNNEVSAGAGRDGKLRELIEEWRDEAAEITTVANEAEGKNLFVTAAGFGASAAEKRSCADELEALLAVPDPLASDTGQGVAVAGRMERSIADFIRACGVHLVAQQESIMPDNALIAVLCDAIRLARESIQAASAPLASSSAPQGEKTNETTKI